MTIIVCRRCGQPRPRDEYIFVPVKIDADILNLVPGDRTDPDWRTLEAAMQAGCRTCRHADYADAANHRDGCDFDHDNEECA